MKKQTAIRPLFQKCMLLVFLSFVIVISGCGNTGGAPDQTAYADTQAVQETAEAEPSTQAVNPQETCAHQWQKWVLGETEMTRVCEICQLEESMAIDRGIYVTQQLEGHWDLYGVYTQQTGLMPAMYVLGDDTVGPYFRFDPEGTAQLFDGETTSTVTCRFQEYDPEKEFYKIAATGDSDGSEIALYFDGIANRIQLATADSVLVFDQNLETVEKMTGIWAGSENGSVYSLELHEDRSFTADFGETFTGTWHLRTPVDMGGYPTGGLGLKYTQNDSTVMQNSYLNYDGDESSFGMKLEDGGYATFNKVDEETLNQMKETAQASTSAITGQWTAINVMDYSIEGHSLAAPVSGYVMTFAEDGTFTASLDQERFGTWRFVSVLSDGSLFYELLFDGISQGTHIQIRPESGEFNLYNSETSRDLTFVQMTEDKKAALEADWKKAGDLIAGDWTSFSVQGFNDSTDTMDFSYTISFAPDGTFTSNLKDGSSGKWWIAYVSYGNCYYYLETDTTNQKFYGSLYEYNRTLNFTDSGRDIQFGQYSDEELKKIEEAPGRLIGSWSSENNSMTINADGTFTSTLEAISSGTWSFIGYEEGKWVYEFMIDDSYTGYHYRLSADGVLDVWYFGPNDGQESEAMTKD